MDSQQDAMTALKQYRLQCEETGRELGRGSYAAVVEVCYKGLKCAGKKIHRILYEEQVEDLVRRFQEECRLLSQLRHPHIVQFIGIYLEPHSNVPVLVMEYLPTTLTQCMDRYGIMPKEVNYSVLKEVALGLCFLHEQTPPIIHRDLSANNVLLTENMTAKISDLGVAKLVNLTPSQMTRMTKAPGTPCYMPPEALIENPRYSIKIDAFSFGVLIAHVFSGKWPFPTEPTVLNPKNPDELVPVSEAGRRKEYLKKMGDEHPLMTLTLQCLSNNPSCRPEAAPIFQRLKDVASCFPQLFINRVDMLLQIKADDNEKQLLRSVSELEESRSTTAKELSVALFEENKQLIEQLQGELDQVNLASKLQRERHGLEMTDLKASLLEQEKELKGELRIKEEELKAQVRGKDTLIKLKEEVVTRMVEVLAVKDTIIISKEEAIRRKDTAINCLTQQLDQMQEQMSSQVKEFSPKLQWQKCSGLPWSRSYAHAVKIANNVYVGGGKSDNKSKLYLVFRYDLYQDTWSTLPAYPSRFFGLGEIDSKLVAVGGTDSKFKSTTSDVLLFDSNKWQKSIRPMPTPRYVPFVLSYKSNLVVGGGILDDKSLSIVELYKSDICQWHTATPMPVPSSDMRTTMIGSRAYIMGGYTCKSRSIIDPTKSVFTVSLPSLLEHTSPVDQAQDIGNSTIGESVWTALPDVPCYCMTPVNLGGSLLALGGKGAIIHDVPSKWVYAYSPYSATWIEVGDMPDGRINCTAIQLSHKKILLIGGYNSGVHLLSIYKIY